MWRLSGYDGELGQDPPQSPGCPHPYSRLTGATGSRRGTPPLHHPASAGSPAPGGRLAEPWSYGSKDQWGVGHRDGPDRRLVGQFRGAWVEFKVECTGCALHTSGRLLSPRLGSKWHPLASCSTRPARPYPATGPGGCTHFSMASMVFSSLSPDPVWGTRVGPSFSLPHCLITPVSPG